MSLSRTRETLEDESEATLGRTDDNCSATELLLEMLVHEQPTVAEMPPVLGSTSLGAPELPACAVSIGAGARYESPSAGAIPSDTSGCPRCSVPTHGATLCGGSSGRHSHHQQSAAPAHRRTHANERVHQAIARITDLLKFEVRKRICA